MRDPRASRSASTLTCGAAFVLAAFVLGACAALSACDLVLGIPDRKLVPNLVCEDGKCQCATGFAACDDGCTPLDTDEANCGACGHGCLGGACQGGRCQPVEIGSSSVVSLLVSDGAVYVGSCNETENNCTMGSALQVLPSGCAPPSTACLKTLWTATDDTVYSIAASGDDLVWADKVQGNPPGKIYKSSPGAGADGGADAPTLLVTLVPGNLVVNIAASPTMVYWTNFDLQAAIAGPLHRISVMGGTVEPITQGPVLWVAADPSNAYYLDATNALYAVPHTGPPTPVLLASNLSAGSLVVDGQTVYIGGAEGIQSVPIGGGPPKVRVQTSSRVQAMALDGSYLYWGEANGTVQKVPRAGGDPVTLVEKASIGLAKLVVDDRAVYYSGGIAFGPLYMIAK